MRKIVGALIVFFAAASYKVADLSLFRNPSDEPRACGAPSAPVEAQTLEEPKSPARSSAGESTEARAAGSPERVAVNSTRKAVSRKKRSSIPTAFFRDPLLFFSTAPVDSLMQLPGLGPVLAERIVVARSGKRSFRRWEDLLAVKGIGRKTVDRWRRLAEEAGSG